MSSPILDVLARTTAHRYQSFAEAATSALDLLHAVAPGERLALAQIDWEEGACRVIDSRGGDETLRGLVVPLAGRGFSSSGAIDAGELLDPRELDSIGLTSSVATPLDASDGRMVGLLLATGAGAHVPLLPVMARLLSYEWESIDTRAELRRLGELARDRERTDPVTGLDNRRTLLTAIDREWQLGKRGTVESYLVTIRLAGRDSVRERTGAAAADLLLKDVAEVFSGGIRRTDHLGRAGDDLLAAVLVGCREPAGAHAFVARCERALVGVTAGRPAPVELAYGYQGLAGSPSPEAALEAAERAAREAVARKAGGLETSEEAAA